jgi:hypothetical protein
MLRLEEMRRNRTAGAGSRKGKAGGVMPAGFSLNAETRVASASHWVASMIDTLNPDVHSLKEWLRGAWRQLADANLTRLEQRELRYYMKDAEHALRADLKRIAERDMAKARARDDSAAHKRPSFRLLQLNT